jgi:hypothetical protein
MMLEEGSDAAEAKAVKERFFREAESAGTLNHPNIVRIFDAGEEQDIAYIAMELLDGHDFTRYTKKPDLLPLEVVLETIATVADALDYAHGQGIVHRDIKPANFMRIKDGTIRVADFGIARITGSSKTATGTVMGTPSYMSPEQVAGKKVDGRSDLFSLTVALFELLTGDKPFKGEEIGTLVFAIANNPHPDPAALRADLPDCVRAVIDKGLAKDPAQRFARGSQMAAALRQCLEKIKAGDAPATGAAAAEPVAAEPAAAERAAAEIPAAEPAAAEVPAAAPESTIADMPVPEPSADWAAEAAPTLAAAAAEASAAARKDTADEVLASLATVSMQAPDPEPEPAPAAPASEVTVPGLPEITVPSITMDTTPSLAPLEPAAPAAEASFELAPEPGFESTLTITPLEQAPAPAAPEVPSVNGGADDGATIKLTLPPPEGS